MSVAMLTQLDSWMSL